MGTIRTMNKLNNNDHDLKVDVCVIGLGYIGLPTAAFIASKNITVVGVDIDSHHVAKINAGTLPFHEPGLELILQDVVAGVSSLPSRPPLRPTFTLLPFRRRFNPISRLTPATFVRP